MNFPPQHVQSMKHVLYAEQLTVTLPVTIGQQLHALLLKHALHAVNWRKYRRSQLYKQKMFFLRCKRSVIFKFTNGVDSENRFKISQQFKMQ